MAKDKLEVALMICIEDSIELSSLTIKVIKVASYGDEKLLIDAVAISLAENEKLRRIINAAGKIANQIRRGEIAKPDINVRNN